MRRLKFNNPDDILKLHGMKKRYTCTTCGKSYSLKSSLVRHKRNECNVEPKFECTLCKRKFAHKYNMKHHFFKCKKFKLFYRI